MVGEDDKPKREQASQARLRGRYMEAEVRDVLTNVFQRTNIGLALMEASQEVGGAQDLVSPPRSDEARAVNFEQCSGH